MRAAFKKVAKTLLNPRFWKTAVGGGHARRFRAPGLDGFGDGQLGDIAVSRETEHRYSRLREPRELGTLFPKPGGMPAGDIEFGPTEPRRREPVKQLTEV
ncbi:hypothetical protein SAMN04488498_10557 [Mesorhizobium albiziae]|uniref:Uncharacterized protein n=1 Tax=Neomesorhizobium albiziae TaxID=335020 RepID=A0A1I3YNA1_9HYPH|nr:hypothetical protein [Mesorhizobium albiziae]GLS33393.1 hypothetical protein GCM10007937_51040 [Mesorhizobium albiziae]SFK33255.1 hypothetical protein SAMN04488498_10557 [Mesorhizobium albiziae]